jgi:hypothetical protein
MDEGHMDDPIYREDLDLRGCDDPDCQEDHGPLYFSSVCHGENDLLRATYLRGGSLVLSCAECGREIVRLAIASRGASG